MCWQARIVWLTAEAQQEASLHFRDLNVLIIYQHTTILKLPNWEFLVFQIFKP
jgi:hypothetical protein